MKFWITGVLVLLLVLLAAAAGVIWYQATTLKARVAGSIGRALHADVQVTSLDVDLWKGELHAAGITLTNQRPDAPWDHAEVGQAVAHFNWRDLFSPVIPLRIEVSLWHLNLRPAPTGTPADVTATDSVSPADSSPAARHGIKVTELSGTQGDVEITSAPGEKTLLHDVSFDATTSGGSVWTTQLRASSIVSGTLSIGSSSVQIDSETGKVTFTDLHMQCAEGAITGNGSRDLAAPHAARATLQAVDVPVIMLVGAAWQMKLSGLASGGLAYQGDDTGGQANGQLSVAHGKFNVLPFLGKVVGLVGLPDISGVEVDKATTDFTWKNRALHLANIDVRKNDVTRISGSVDVGADSQVDGHLKVGLPDAILGKWPQLQSQIFSSQSDDYGWTDVHLTGTPDHLQEDLTSRVLAVGLQNGTDAVKTGAQKAVDLIKGFLGN